MTLTSKMSDPMTSWTSLSDASSAAIWNLESDAAGTRRRNSTASSGKLTAPMLVSTTMTAAAAAQMMSALRSMQAYASAYNSSSANSGVDAALASCTMAVNRQSSAPVVMGETATNQSASGRTTAMTSMKEPGARSRE